jgi:hypothetical protein
MMGMMGCITEFLTQFYLCSRKCSKIGLMVYHTLLSFTTLPHALTSQHLDNNLLSR